MLKCNACGAELQNPTDRFGETAVNWLSIHGKSPHLVQGDIDEIIAIKAFYEKYHDKQGRRTAAVVGAING